MAGEDEIEGRNRDDGQMHYNSTNLSSDWLFNASNDLTNTSMAMVTSSNPMNNDSCSSASMIDYFIVKDNHKRVFQPKNDARQGGSGFSGNNLLGESEYSEDLAVQDETSHNGLGSKKRRRSDQTKIRLLQKAFLQIQDETQSKQLPFPHERSVVPCELLSELLQ
ncbi:hypothetical protein L2E82_33943 [Cichorium intybus]|uniref:Uncharacterized protein n=1 Tax=Cichorium intybus TaxID=13427 RepID=A0ACB9BLD7_CICIN|nr:hypothetical protein L2E82_33943 [Cichorium intybus]